MSVLVSLSIVLAAWIELAAPAAARASARSSCAAAKGKRPEVFVKAKTPVRRGPGLNYPVSAFIEEGRCVQLGELSLDQSWVRVEDDGRRLFGWVPASALDAESKREIAELGGPSAAPIGSGQKRSYVRAESVSRLLARPEAESKPKKKIPRNAKLVPLSITGDGQWVEVRDDRNETGWIAASVLIDPSGILAELPKTSAGLETGMAAASARPAPPAQPAPPAPSARQAAAAPQDEMSGSPAQPTFAHAAPAAAEPSLAGGAPRDFTLSAVVLAEASLPQHGLESNAAAGFRRYALRARAMGARVEAIAGPLGPIEARLTYGFAYLSGISPKGDPARSIDGQEHQGRLVLGAPIAIEAARLRIVPEGGYAMTMFTVTPSLPGATIPLFLSTQTHALSLGLRASIEGLGPLALEAEGGATAGMMIVSPLEVGEGGTALGFRFGGGARLAVSAGLELLLRADYRQHRASFDGKSTFDRTITSATLTDVAYGLMAGVAFGL